MSRFVARADFGRRWYPALGYDTLTRARFDLCRPQDIIIFIVGGTTYEEAKTVAQLNAQFAAGHGLAGSIGPAGPVSQNTRIVLGGTCVHNSKRYVARRRSSGLLSRAVR